MLTHDDDDDDADLIFGQETWKVVNQTFGDVFTIMTPYDSAIKYEFDENVQRTRRLSSVIKCACGVDVDLLSRMDYVLYWCL